MLYLVCMTLAISEGLDVPPTGPWAVREWETTWPDAVI